MTDWNSTVPTILAGYVPSGDDWSTILSELTALTDSWTDWSSSFSISGTTTGVTQGSSTYASRYKRIGKRLEFEFKVSINTGGGFSAGSGTWLFNMPFAVALSERYVGRAFVFDSGTAGYPSIILASTALGTTSQCVIYHNTSGTALGSSGPGTAWATNDFIVGQIEVELA